jgi:3'-5' exoribonuclease
MTSYGPKSERWKTAMTDTAEIQLFIDQLRDGDNACMTAAVVERQYKVVGNGKPLLSMTLQNRTGTIAAACWGATREHIDVKPGDVVYLEGSIGTFNDALQVNVHTGPVIVTEYDLADLLPSTSFNIDSLWSALMHYIDGIQDDHLRAWLEKVVNDEEISPRLKRWPAGKRMHHAYLGGLLEHIVSMTKTAWLICNHHKRLNRGLLVAGCVLHDLAKIEELSVGTTFGYTTVGTLHGHVVLGYSLIDRMCQRYALDSDLRMQIQHLVLSHHGSMEHGAAKLPSMPEAIVLHHIDMIDAQLNSVYAHIDKAQGDEFTPYIPSLERVLYCGPVKVQEPAEVVGA